VAREQPFEFPTEEEVDPNEQDRRHTTTLTAVADADNRPR
jgi:hypothetical protein